MSSKHPNTRPERRHNLDKRAAPRLRIHPFLKDVLEPALDRDPTLARRLYEGLRCSPASQDSAGIIDPALTAAPACNAPTSSSALTPST